MPGCFLVSGGDPDKLVCANCGQLVDIDAVDVARPDCPPPALPDRLRDPIRPERVVERDDFADGLGVGWPD